MTTIIAATNRPNSNTLMVAKTYQKVLKEKGLDSNFCSLEELPVDFLHSTMYGNPSPSFKDFQDKYLIPTKKFLFVMPEYNGGFPGVIKLMIDASNIAESYRGKKAGLVGVSSGRAGNLRGMEHFTGILNYLQVQVLPNKLPISVIDTLETKDGLLSDSQTLKSIDLQCEQFIKF